MIALVFCSRPTTWHSYACEDNLNTHLKLGIGDGLGNLMHTYIFVIVQFQQQGLLVSHDDVTLIGRGAVSLINSKQIKKRKQS